MTSVPRPLTPESSLTLKYDAWNRLVEVKDGQTVVGKYEYDGDNRRIKKHIDSQSPGSPDGIDRYEHLFYAGVQLVETRNTTTQGDQPESLQPKYQYIWSPRYVDAPILRDENTDQDSLCDDARIYYLADANMNVTSLVDTAGDALERYVYDPYGRVTIYNADWSSTRSSSSYGNYVLYTGRHLDAETGLYYYRARYYSAELGRFLSRDPIGYRAGINLYAYVDNSPLARVDPTGHSSTLDNYVRQIEERLSRGDRAGAAEIAMNMYVYIAYWGGWVRPLSGALLQNWLSGAPKDPYLLTPAQTQSAFYAAKELVRVAICAQVALAGGSSGVTDSFPSMSLEASSGDYHSALHGFSGRVKGRWRSDRAGHVTVTGMWGLTDRYDWHAGHGGSIDGTTIKDDYAILVAEFYQVAEFDVVGNWYGTMEFDCCSKSKPPSGSGW